MLLTGSRFANKDDPEKAMDERELFNAQLQLAQTKRDELLALVRLYKALGGGWQP